MGLYLINVILLLSIIILIICLLCKSREKVRNIHHDQGLHKRKSKPPKNIYCYEEMQAPEDIEEPPALLSLCFDTQPTINENEIDITTIFQEGSSPIDLSTATIVSVEELAVSPVTEQVSYGQTEFFQLPGGSNDVTYDGINIWTTSHNNLVNTITKIDRMTGVILGTFPTGTNPLPIEFDGTNIWVGCVGSITIHDPTNGNIVSIIVVNSVRYLYFDGIYMWATDIIGNTLTKYTTSGTVVDSVSTGLIEPYGIAYDGTYVWVVSSGNNRLVRFLASDLTIIPQISLITGSISCLYCASDGTNVWVTDWLGDTIYKMDGVTGAVISSHPVSENPFNVIFDGTNIITTGGGGIRKIDINSGETLIEYPLGLFYSRGLISLNGELWICGWSTPLLTKITNSDNWIPHFDQNVNVDPLWTVYGSNALQSQNDANEAFFTNIDLELIGYNIQFNALPIATLTSGADSGVFGFTLGYNVGDEQNPNADYLVVSWCGDVEYGIFTTGTSIVRQQGIPSISSVPGEEGTISSFTEIVRGINFGQASWGVVSPQIVPIVFRIEYISGVLYIYIDEQLEFQLPWVFDNGSNFGFFMGSQTVRFDSLYRYTNVTCDSIENTSNQNWITTSGTVTASITNNILTVNTQVIPWASRVGLIVSDENGLVSNLGYINVNFRNLEPNIFRSAVSCPNEPLSIISLLGVPGTEDGYVRFLSSANIAIFGSANIPVFTQYNAVFQNGLTGIIRVAGTNSNQRFWGVKNLSSNLYGMIKSSPANAFASNNSNAPSKWDQYGEGARITYIFGTPVANLSFSFGDLDGSANAEVNNISPEANAWQQTLGGTNGAGIQTNTNGIIRYRPPNGDNNNNMILFWRGPLTTLSFTFNEQFTVGASSGSLFCEIPPEATIVS